MGFSIHKNKKKMSDDKRQSVIDMFSEGNHPLLISKTVQCSLDKVTQILRVEKLVSAKFTKSDSYWPRNTNET